MPQGRSEPFFFGREDEQLFGCLHVATAGRAAAPGGPRARESGLVIVPPMDQEYLRAHRALRMLATRLATDGYPVLRFDYYACGDSAGACERGSLARWVRDVDDARAELAARVGGPARGLIGLRLGASLALRSAVRAPVRAAVLWEPVVDGGAFLAGLRTAHEAMIRGLQSRPKPSWEREASLDLLGFPFPDELLAELEAVDVLAELEAKPADRVLLLGREESAERDALGDRLEALGASVRRLVVPGPRIWEEDVSKGLIPRPSLDAIAEWVREELP